MADEGSSTRFPPLQRKKGALDVATHHLSLSSIATMAGLAGFICSALRSPIGFCSAFPLPETGLNQCTVAKDIPLRILSIGDSITAGWGDPEQNSYRLPLWNELDADCANRNQFFIGTRNSGSMLDDLHEGYPGYPTFKLLNDIRYDLFVSLNMKPNVVLIHAGTNDVDPKIAQPASWQSAASNLGKIVDLVIGAVPDVTVLVAKVIMSNVTNSDLIPKINAMIPAMIAEKQDAGEKVLMVDMSHIGVGGAGLSDGLHPSPDGYKQMAEVWFKGLQEATKRNWITPPGNANY